MINITLKNSGGELGTYSARTAAEAAQVFAKAIAEMGEVYPGDSFEITGHEEEDA